MSGASGSGPAAQVIATLKHEKLNLKKQLTDVQLENQVLRQQLFHVSTLLDIAMSKLGTVGISLESPVDIRALRANVLKCASAQVAQDGTIDASDLALSKEKDHTSQNRRFQARVVLRGHTKAVQCCAFSPGEDPLIATGGMDCRLLVQNFFTGERQWEVRAHHENISDVAWFEGTHNILSASYDNTVKLWDTNRPESLPVYRYNANGFLLSIIPLDKAFVFACADSRRRTSIVDVRTPKPISWEHDSRVNTLTFDSSTARLVMGHSNGILSLWDIRKVGLALSYTVAPSEGSSATGQVGGTQPHLPSSTLSTSTQGSGITSATSTRQDGETSLPLPQPLSGLPAHCVARIANEASRSSISFLAHYHSKDDTKRLICVSDDNMVRLYRSNFDELISGDSHLYSLRNVLPGVPSRGYSVRAGFWKGKKEKSQVSVFFDDGEKDCEPGLRRLGECDLLVTGGADNTATIFDVSEENNVTVLEHLEGHHDRVTGAAAHHSDSRPIIATTSADSTVRIWMPVKT